MGPGQTTKGNGTQPAVERRNPIIFKGRDNIAEALRILSKFRSGTVDTGSPSSVSKTSGDPNRQEDHPVESQHRPGRNGQDHFPELTEKARIIREVGEAYVKKYHGVPGGSDSICRDLVSIGDIRILRWIRDEMLDFLKRVKIEHHGTFNDYHQADEHFRMLFSLARGHIAPFEQGKLEKTAILHIGRISPNKELRSYAISYFEQADDTGALNELARDSGYPDTREEAQKVLKRLRDAKKRANQAAFLSEAKNLESRADDLYQEGGNSFKTAADLYSLAADKYDEAGDSEKAEEMRGSAAKARDQFDSWDDDD